MCLCALKHKILMESFSVCLQWSVLLHSVCKGFRTPDKKLLRQSILACCVSLSYFSQVCHACPFSLSVVNFCYIRQHLTCVAIHVLPCRLCVPGGFMLATVLGCVCLGIASLIYLSVNSLSIIIQC